MPSRGQRDAAAVRESPEQEPGVGTLLSGRYRIDSAIGRGGMAEIFRATDQASGNAVALKLLRVHDTNIDVGFRKELFEREFHALSQLSHPRAVQVLDYAVSESGPFYTMELLTGQDISQLAPMPWRRACAMMRDVTSVLSLLHSRRLLYRDLNPHNVRCTVDGVAKLIDFGALMPMGNARKVVGNPPFVAPELVNRQMADGRADLYGVGTTLYYALTGKLAFPARQFHELSLVWCTSPRPPSEHVAEIPRALDDLVLDLIRIEPAFRPPTAGEVIDRLEAIAELEANEALMVTRAYLATPALVEREDDVARISKRLQGTPAGKGTAVLVAGSAGVGRSRLLDACVLNAKLASMTVLLADSADGQKGPYGAAQSLAAQLLDAAPEEAKAGAQPHLSVLAHALPQLMDAWGPVELAQLDGRAMRPAIQAALRGWLQQVSRTRPLLIAVDDIDRIDEPTAALLALLAADVADYSLSVVVSAQDPAAGNHAALEVLHASADCMALEPLSPAGTRALLESVFGDDARMRLLSARLHDATEGIPRDLMQLAQHLVDRRVIRYDAGAWILPAQLSTDDLPASASDAMRDRVSALGERTLTVARFLSLSTVPVLELEDFKFLLKTRAAGRVLASLGELVEADVIRVTDGRFSMARPAWADVLTVGLDRETERTLHASLADLFAQSGQDPIRRAHHLRMAGADEAAVDLIVAFSADSSEATAANPHDFLRFVEDLPSFWYELFDWAVLTAKRLGRPPAAVYELQARMAGILPVADPNVGAEHMSELLEQLNRDAGLEIYAGLDDTLEPMERLKQALDTAQARYEAAPEETRVLPALSAIKPLARTLIPTAAVAATTYDYELCKRAPSLTPLHPLSPALQVVTLVWQGLRHRMAGRMEQAIDAYEQMIALIDRPDRAGLDPSHATYSRLGMVWGIGNLQASMGLERCLESAHTLENDPWYRASGFLVRMLYAYWQGEPEQADAHKRRWMLNRIESRSQQWFDGGHLVAELTAHAVAGDLARLKAVLQDVEMLAERAPGWRPVQDYAEGEHHRLRGDLRKALAKLTAARTALPACTHQMWAYAASSELQVLIAQERWQDAVTRGREYLTEAESTGLGFLTHFLRIPLEIAYAGVGQPERALEMSANELARLEDEGVSGLMVGWANEAHAQIALMADDPDMAEAHLAPCVTHFRAAANPIGRRRCDRLLGQIRDHRSHNDREHEQRTFKDLEAKVQAAAAGCTSLTDKATAMLQLLLSETCAEGGMLRAFGGTGENETVAQGLGERGEEVSSLLEQLSTDFDDEDDEMGTITSTHTESSAAEFETRYQPILLRPPGDQRAVGVAVLLLPPGERFRDMGTLATLIGRSLVQSED